MIPGIDLAGTIVESEAPGFEKGEQVIVTSYDLGVSHIMAVLVNMRV